METLDSLTILMVNNRKEAEHAEIKPKPYKVEKANPDIVVQLLVL